MAAFSVVSDRVGGVHFLTPVGKLDLGMALVLQREFDAVERGNATIIVVNLSRLTFLDASGIDLLLAMHETCGGDPGRLRVIHGSRPIRRALEVAGVRDALPMVPLGTADHIPI